MTRSIAPKVVGLYARTSSDEQREVGSIRTQLEYARKRARLEGWRLVEFVDDGVSGKKYPLAKRPAGARLLEAIARHELQAVATYRLDRLGRRARFIHEALDAFEAAGVAYMSLTEPFDTSTPAGKLLPGMLAVMSEFESDSIAQRTSDGRDRVARIDNRWTGGPTPYGFLVNEHKELVVKEDEARIIRMIFDLCIREGLGAERIARTLNEEGIPYASTGPRVARSHKEKVAAPWHNVAVADVLRNPLYAGRATYYARSKLGRQLVHRSVPAIVSPATFAAARRVVEARHKWAGSHAKYDYLLRGLLVCARDGRSLIGRMWYGKGDGRRGEHSLPIYYCKFCPRGDRPIVPEEKVLEVLWVDVLDFLSHPDETLRAMARSEAEAGSAEDRAERDALEIARAISELEDQETKLVSDHLRSRITPAVFERTLRAIHNERAKAERRIQEAREARAAAARAARESQEVRQLLRSLRGIAEDAGTDRRRRAEIVRTVTKGIAVHRAGGRTRLAITYAFQGTAAADLTSAPVRVASSSSVPPQTAPGADSRRTPSSPIPSRSASAESPSRPWGRRAPPSSSRR